LDFEIITEERIFSTGLKVRTGKRKREMTMKVSKKMAKALKKQVNQEVGAASSVVPPKTVEIIMNEASFQYLGLDYASVNVNQSMIGRSGGPIVVYAHDEIYEETNGRHEELEIMYSPADDAAFFDWEFEPNYVSKKGPGKLLGSLLHMLAFSQSGNKSAVVGQKYTSMNFNVAISMVPSDYDLMSRFETAYEIQRDRLIQQLETSDRMDWEKGHLSKSLDSVDTLIETELGEYAGLMDDVDITVTSEEIFTPADWERFLPFLVDVISEIEKQGRTLNSVTPSMIEQSIKHGVLGWPVTLGEAQQVIRKFIEIAAFRSGVSKLTKKSEEKWLQVVNNLEI
jgi:hypothetical protein